MRRLKRGGDGEGTKVPKLGKRRVKGERGIPGSSSFPPWNQQPQTLRRTGSPLPPIAYISVIVALFEYGNNIGRGR